MRVPPCTALCRVASTCVGCKSCTLLGQHVSGFMFITHLIKTMLPTRKSEPRSSRQSDHTKDLLTIVKRRKLQWYGRVSRSSGLAKTILQGTVKGERRQGRQKNRLEDKSGNGQAWSSPRPRGQWRTEKNGGNWL